jgi:hypothetical protein
MCQTTQKCSKCGVEYPLTEQYFSKNQSTNTGGNKYYRTDCKICNKKMNQGKNEAFKKAGKPKRPDFGYDKETKKTIDGWPCDNCGKTTYPKAIVFDHCHKTLEHRGWLCDSCNRSIGVLGDDQEGLAQALGYVTKIPKNEILDFINNFKIKNNNEPPTTLR